MWQPGSPRNCYDPCETEQEETLRNPLREETQTRDDLLEGDPSEKTHQKEADPLKEGHPSEEDHPLV